MCGSSCPIIRGVKPRFTSLRYRVWSGGSIISMRLPAGVPPPRSGAPARSSRPTTPPRAAWEEKEAGVAVAGDDVGVLGDHPEAGTVGLGVLVHGRVGAQVREPLVGDALGEAVAVEQVDVGELHVVSP